VVICADLWSPLPCETNRIGVGHAAIPREAGPTVEPAARLCRPSAIPWKDAACDRCPVVAGRRMRRRRTGPAARASVAGRLAPRAFPGSPRDVVSPTEGPRLPAQGEIRRPQRALRGTNPIRQKPLAHNTIRRPSAGPAASPSAPGPASRRPWTRSVMICADLWSPLPCETNPIGQNSPTGKAIRRPPPPLAPCRPPWPSARWFVASIRGDLWRSALNRALRNEPNWRRARRHPEGGRADRGISTGRPERTSHAHEPPLRNEPNWSEQPNRQSDTTPPRRHSRLVVRRGLLRGGSWTRSVMICADLWLDPLRNEPNARVALFDNRMKHLCGG
jgi:hypothetical protein